MLQPTHSEQEIKAVLQKMAQELYGSERAVELNEMINDVAGSMHRIAQEELDFQDPAPDTSGHNEDEE